MKLRIKGNSIRFRLTESEVAQFQRTGQVSEVLVLGIGKDQQIEYRLERREGIEIPAVSFLNQQLTLAVPEPLAVAWTETDRVGFDHTQAVGGGEELFLLVEKDFACLHRQPGDDSEDAYPHPAEQNPQ